MSTGKSSGSTRIGTRRQAIREKRKKQQRRQRLYIIFGVVGAAIILAALLILPNLLTPVGDIATITPQSRPMVDGRAMGDPNAPVTIEVFEDFQCSSCKTYSEQIEPQIVENYIANGDVYYIFRQFPFLDDQAIRKQSDQAANASMCAADQNHFWEYHDILFANQTHESQMFSDKRLQAFAEKLGLDMGSFNQCFNRFQHRDEIDADLAKGKEAGVTGTPSVFVNGRILTPGYVPSFAEISQAIDAELTQSGN